MAIRNFISEKLGGPHLPTREQYRVAIETLIASFEVETSNDEAGNLSNDIASRFGLSEWFV